MKKLFLYFFMSLFMISVAFAAVNIGTITATPDNVYGVNDKNINLNAVVTGAISVVADFSNVENGMSEKKKLLLKQLID